MKLVAVHVTNFRSVLDSNEVEIGPLTCLVGKNEAGKTAFLKALEGLRSVDEDYNEYGKTENYPRRFLADYADRHDEAEARVISTKWEMSDEDVNALNEYFDTDVVTSRVVTISKYYNSDSSNWTIPLDQSNLLSRLAERFALSPEERNPLDGIRNTYQAYVSLENLPEITDKQSQLLEELKTYRNNSALLSAIDILALRTPKFLYFSHYDRMSGQLSINQLAKDMKAGGIDDGDQVFLDFLEYAGTNLEELENSTRFEELNAKCEAAANRITDQIFEYWTQNDQLSIDVRLDEGKSDDDPPFNSGPVARARVKNDIHRVSVPFSERSAGFIWFFSFLVKFAQIRKTQGNVIILLDEPGLTLHGTAQKDLLRYFREQLEPHHQVVYSTHSPFLVPADDLVSVRTVEDVVVRDDRGRLKSDGTKIRSDVLTTDPQTNFPVFGAMGFEVTQGLIISPDTLLVEGPGDILYLQALSRKLISMERVGLDPKWAICPSGGIDKVLPFVRLFYGNGLNTVVLTDFDRGQKRKLDSLYKSELLENERIILATEISGQEEADIEDFFHPSLLIKLINQTYGLSGNDRLTQKKLDEADPTTPRIVKKVEAFFRTLPDSIPMFNHFNPSLYLLKNPELLDADSEAVNQTLDAFEEAFKRISKY